MILAALGAVLVFVSVLSYVGEVRAQVGDKRTVLRLTEDVPANSEIDPGMVEPVQRPEKWTSETMFRSMGELQGRVAASDLPAGTYLQEGSVIPAPSLRPGQQEIAILINAETGVAGKVQPGSVVDIYATFEGTETQPKPCAVRVMSSVRVISVGDLQTQQSTGDSIEESQVVPLTFALDEDAINRLMYAEAFSNTLRLALVSGANRGGASSDKVCDVPSTAESAVMQDSAPPQRGPSENRRQRS